MDDLNMLRVLNRLAPARDRGFYRGEDVRFAFNACKFYVEFMREAVIADTEIFFLTEYSEGKRSCQRNSAAGRSFWLLEGKYFESDAHGSIQGVLV